jgi:DNA replication protein DnaC
MKTTQATRELLALDVRALKMPGLHAAVDGLCRQAVQERWSFEEFLHEALASEIASRQASSVKLRLAEARFPDIKTLDQYDFKATGAIDRGVVTSLARGAYIDAAEGVVLAGPVGTGKTHIAIALGVEACRQRRHVAFWRAADLVRALIEARDTRELGRIHRRMHRAELLILDELGFVPFDRQGGELLFNLLTERHQRRSTVITTNLPFSEWPSVFGGDERLTTALLDRLTESATIITTKGTSYRMSRRAKAAKDSKEVTE